MADQSPPKRVTRARAAARTTDTTVKTARIATASARAKATRATPAPSAKRKTRADDAAEVEEKHDDEEADDLAMPEPARSTRGRPRKTANVEEETVKGEEAVPAPVRATRGRPKKAVVEVSEPAPAPAPTLEPTRSTRGRPKKVDAGLEAQAETSTEPVRKTTRSRATATKPATAAKKNVTFEETSEPNKENQIPARAGLKGKAKAVEETLGMRAKPVRKAATTRATRGQDKKSADAGPPEEPEKAPLSPKKVTQLATSKESSSDDELATSEKTPMKPLSKTPMKLPGNVFGTAKKPDFTISIADKASSSTAQDFGASLASPARRPPSSPFKEGMKDSPKRLAFADSILHAPFRVGQSAMKPVSSPFKDSMRASPKRVNMGEAMAQATHKGTLPLSNNAAATFKTSLLQSPAKRPYSPTKVSSNGSPTRERAVPATPGHRTLKVSRFATPKTVQRGIFSASMLAKSKSKSETPLVETATPEDTPPMASQKPTGGFTGRMSSIVPREIEPAVIPDVETVEEQVPEARGTKASEEKENNIPEDDNMNLDDDIIISGDEPELAAEEPTVAEPMSLDDVKEYLGMSVQSTRSTTPPMDPPANIHDSFSLRPEHHDVFSDSESEDELAAESPAYSPAPLGNFKISSKDFAALGSPLRAAGTPRARSHGPSDEESGGQLSPVAGRSSRKARCVHLGMTPLARQLSGWKASSPGEPICDSATSDETAEERAESLLEPGLAEDIHAGVGTTVEPSPVKSSFFDDEMLIRDESDEHAEDIGDLVDEVELNQVELDDEDLALAAEADEMSLLEPDDVEVHHGDFLDPASDAMSEASQEYGDENAIPIDPVLLAHDAQPPRSPVPTTPARNYASRVFHTVSKVPLKPAATESPVRYSPVKRSASVSRIPTQRYKPTSLSRSKTVTTRSPSISTTNTTSQTPQTSHNSSVLDTGADFGSTPIRSDSPLQEIHDPAAWSAAGTPGRTPRKDLNVRTLRGAVVFVDVHTTEGADASGLFVELLTQMGARCVKQWTWNPGHEEDGGKVGITHVVFKDGGKRTLEKVRESRGLVCCVGVGWVLE